jgi:hypothetical protein
VNNVGHYTVSEIRPRIFLLQFKRNYDLCMQFVRYQEFYESPNPKFRDHAFNLLDFMEWYSFSNKQGYFSYPMDWAGFNIPGDTIKKVWDLGITDRNIYDYEMLMLYNKFQKQYSDGKFYVIGACKGNAQTLKHEIAHGFFFTHPEYKKKMSTLVHDLTKPLYTKMCKALKKIGYAPRVYIDECQAYLSTGVPDEFKLNIKKQREPFIKLYDKWYKITK